MSQLIFWILVVMAFTLLLPPKYDPAIRLKEWLSKDRDNDRR